MNLIVKLHSHNDPALFHFMESVKGGFLSGEEAWVWSVCASQFPYELYFLKLPHV